MAMHEPTASTFTTSSLDHGKILCILLILIFSLGSPATAADEQSPKAVGRVSISPPVQQRRVALVIGNSRYQDAPLRNPSHDAEDIGNALRGLGFVVKAKVDVDRRAMEEAVFDFIRDIQNGDVALFFFSGHGVQVKGENFLVPIGDPIVSESDVRYKAVNAGYILAKMEESRNRINIVILDACRNNPFKGVRSGTKGLSMMDAPVGTLIAYATAPGSVAEDGNERNSPYTKHLLRAIMTEGLGIEQAFKRVLRDVRKETSGKQIPWYATSLPDEFYFNPLQTARVHEPVQPEPTRPSPVAIPAPVSEYKTTAQRLVALINTRGDKSSQDELNRMYKDPEAVRW